MVATKQQGDVTGVLPKAIGMLRKLSEAGPAGMRLAEIAESLAMPRASAHRILGTLLTERLISWDQKTKRYTLGLDMFSMAARAGNAHGLRSICRPILLRLTESFGDTFFILVRDGYSAVCIDRSHGSFPIRSITEDIGGRAYLGQGQGPLAILAFLPENEQDEVVSRNISHLRQISIWDEASLRVRMKEVRRVGYASGPTSLNSMTTGVGVPIFDESGRVIAAISLGCPIDRLDADREAIMVDVLKKIAAEIGSKLNPFDPVFRHAAAGLIEA